jgi:asparagine synthase (glutamine-hydrolysing)
VGRAGYFDPQAVQRLVAKCRAGGVVGVGDNMAFVGILSTQLLHSQFVRRGAGAAEEARAPAVV